VPSELNSQIADPAQGESVQSRGLRRHLLEDVLDGMNAVGAADILGQVAQNFPIIACVARRLDRLIEALQAVLLLIIEPRFSAHALDGRVMVACGVVLLARIPIGDNAHRVA